MPERVYAADCVYRKNLKAGRIFYGRRANNFSSEKYNAILMACGALSQSGRTLLGKLLADFFDYHRGVYTQIYHASPALDEVSSVGLFSVPPLGRDFLPFSSDKWNSKKVLALICSNPDDQLSFQAAQELRAQELAPLRGALKTARSKKDKAEINHLERKLSEVYKSKPGERTKEFIRQWLNDFKPLVRDRLSSPYRRVSLPAENILYMEELFLSSQFPFDSSIYWNTAYYVDGLLSPSAAKSEEERRIRLSRGYTQEEKEVLLSALVKTKPEPQKDLDTDE